jgi:hypothetical protein
MPGSADIEGWKNVHCAREEIGLDDADQAVEQVENSKANKDFGGVQALEVKPAGWTDNGMVLIDTLAGAYERITISRDSKICQRQVVRLSMLS